MAAAPGWAPPEVAAPPQAAATLPAAPSLEQARGMVGVPPVPLPVHYPANLVYAQCMLTTCVSQLQSVELTKAMLQMRLRDKQARAAAASLLAAAGPPPAAAAAEPAAAPAAAAVPEALWPGGGPAEGQPAAEGARAEAAGGAPPNPEQQQQQLDLQAHRQRLGHVLKIGVALFLLRCRFSWLIIYVFGAFLYVGGLFNGVVNWWQAPGNQPRQPLEQALNELRARQRAGERDAERAAARARALAAARELGIGAADGEDGDEGAPDRRGVDADGAPAGGEADGAEQPQEQPAVAEEGPPVPGYAARFFYQLVVMFFMTLLPWFKPDPRYLV